MLGLILLGLILLGLILLGLILLGLILLGLILLGLILLGLILLGLILLGLILLGLILLGLILLGLILFGLILLGWFFFQGLNHFLHQIQIVFCIFGIFGFFIMLNRIFPFLDFCLFILLKFAAADQGISKIIFNRRSERRVRCCEGFAKGFKGFVILAHLISGSPLVKLKSLGPGVFLELILEKLVSVFVILIVIQIKSRVSGKCHSMKSKKQGDKGNF